MAVLSGATASGRNFCSVMLTTGATTLYTAKGYTSNVVSDSGATSGTTGAGPATAYIKEIVLTNTSATATTVTINVDGEPILSAVPINGNDTKVLSGLNTMLNAGAIIQGFAGAGTVSCVISGVEVQ